jgi:hypothetical protein
MNVKAKILGAAMGALGLCGLSSAALAGSTTPPGERAGLDLASPLPQGVYFADVAGLGTWRNGPANGNGVEMYNVPVVVWSTPWDILGAHIQLWAAAPELSLSFNHGDHSLVGGPAALGHGGAINSIYNPFVFGQLAWNLGNGFSVSAGVGAYLPITTGDAGDLLNATTIHQMVAFAWHGGGGWNVTVNLYGGEILDQGNCSPTYSPNFVQLTTCQNNGYFNYDIGVTHTFGKWEFGVVGIGSTDFDVPNLPNPHSGYTAAPLSQAQFAVGGLMGYNFGPVIMQLIVATDVYTQNYNAKETQGILHVIVPVWAPEVPKAVIAKY